jgi:hypothetical protein
MIKSKMNDSKTNLFNWINDLKSTIVDESFDAIMTHVENQINHIYQYLEILEIKSRFLS